MYVTEAMINSMEEMQRNAGDMEKHIKAMMETEARMHGLEQTVETTLEICGDNYLHIWLTCQQTNQ